MGRQYERLSALAVKNIKVRGLYPDGAGLYLQVSESGSRSWIFRYTLAGRERQMGLGSTRDVTLAEARANAINCRKLKRDGVDPIVARKAELKAQQLEAAKALSFREAGEAYLDAFEGSWRNAKHGDQWRNTLAAHVYPILGNVSVQSIDVSLVMKVLNPIWKNKNETASRIRGRIEAILDWAAARGFRDGQNPARWRGHLEALLPARSKVRTVEHHAALAYSLMPSFIEKLVKEDGIPARALEFLILTVARTGEVIGGRKGEVNFAEKAWLIPGGRTKSGKPHRVPLCDRALVLLRHCFENNSSDYIFPGRSNDKPLSNMAMLKLLKRMGYDTLTAHGFRSSFRDWTAEETNVPGELAEMALAHVVSNKVEAAYRRGDMFEKRWKLMSDWAAYCYSDIISKAAREAA